MKKALFYLNLFLLITIGSFGQDLSKIKPKEFLKGKGLEIKGGIDASTRWYTPFGLDNRTPTFQYIFTGRLSVDIFSKIKMPVSFSFTNEKANLISSFGRNLPNLPFSQPFNRLSLKPTYKGHTLYIGTNMMSFSSFTLSNFRFNGIGYDYKSPKKPIYGGIMYGVFKKPISIISQITSPLNRPSYKRVGMAAKIGYRRKDDFIDITLLNVWDEKKSILRPLDSLNIFPQSNVALSTKIQKVLFKNTTIGMEIGRSTIFNERNPLENWNLGTRLNESFSQVNNKTALKTGIDFKEKQFNAGVEYSNIDPDYLTFGSYFFNNDIQTFALKTGYQQKDNKFTISNSLGLQSNSKKSLKPQVLNRWVGSIDATIMPTEKINIGVNYSNYLDFTNLQSAYQYLTSIDPFAQLDTLNYRQINQNLGLNATMQLKDKGDYKKSIMGMVNYQKGDSEQGSKIAKNQVLNTNIGFTLLYDPKKISINYGLNYLYSANPFSKDVLYGPIFNLSKSYKEEKIKLSSSIVYNLSNTKVNESGNRQNKNILLGNFGISTTIKKKHILGLTCIFLNNNNRKDKISVGENFSELTFNINYKFNFKGLSLKF